MNWGTVSLALRNLLRNRRRSVMTLFAMTIGLVAVLLFGGYVRDINYALQSDFVRLSGHLQVQHRDYFLYGSGNPSAYGIRDYERILELVKHDSVLAPMLEVATPMLQFGGIAGNFAAGVSRTVYASGTVVEDQKRMRDWNDYGLRVLSKRLSLAGTPPDAAVIGTGVARVLQLCSALRVPDWNPGHAVPPEEGVIVKQNWDEIRGLMWNYVGIVRTDKRLARAERRLDNLVGEIQEYYWGYLVTRDIVELRNLADVARLIVACAQERKESRGLHYTLDCPRTLEEWKKDTVIASPAR